MSTDNNSSGSQTGSNTNNANSTAEVPGNSVTGTNYDEDYCLSTLVLERADDTTPETTDNKQEMLEDSCIIKKNESELTESVPGSRQPIEEWIKQFLSDDDDNDDKNDTPESLADFIHENIPLGHFRTIKFCLKDKSVEERKHIVDMLRNGKSALLVACEKGAKYIVKYLLEECEADPNLGGDYMDGDRMVRVTPLWVSVVEEHRDLLKILLNNGADINLLPEVGSTPVHAACLMENVLIVKDLCEAGADVNIPNSFGNTCLKDAIGNINISKILIDHGADVNYNKYIQYPILHCAIKTRNLETVAMLLEKGADLQALDHEGNDALTYAILSYCPDIVGYVLEFQMTEPQKEADAYDLLGAVAIGKNEYKQAFELWIRAMFTRIEKGGGPSSLTDPLPVLGPISVPGSIQELIKLVKNVDNMEILALAILNHQLGPKHSETLHRILMHASALMNDRDLNPALDVSIYSYRILMEKHEHLHSIQEFALSQVVQICNKMKQDLLPGVPLSKVQEILSIFSNMVDHIAQAVHLKDKDLMYFESRQNVFDKILLHIFDLMFILKSHTKSPEHISSFKWSVQKLVKCNPRGLNGDTLVHKTLTRTENALYPFLHMQQNEAKFDDLVVLRELIYAGSDVNAQDLKRDTPLHAFLKWSQKQNFFFDKVITCLLEGGAHIDMRDIDGRTAQGLLKDANYEICPVKYTRLECLAVQEIISRRLPYRSCLPMALQLFIDSHK